MIIYICLLFIISIIFKKYMGRNIEKESSTITSEQTNENGLNVSLPLSKFEEFLRSKDSQYKQFFPY